MISTELIKSLVEQKIAESNLFLVDVKVDNANNIVVFVDSGQGVDVEQCVAISRHIEDTLDREIEDFALEVSSPGIGYPFKVIEQYTKAIGRTIEVLFLDGIKIDGTLTRVFNDGFEVLYEAKEKSEGAKRPKMVEKNREIKFNEIKSVKETIKF